MCNKVNQGENTEAKLYQQNNLVAAFVQRTLCRDQIDRNERWFLENTIALLNR